MSHPEHWNSYTGPAHWYRVWYPPTWRVEETDGAVRLIPSDGHGVLTLSCLWIPEGTDADLEAIVDLEALFTRRRHVRRLRPLEIPYPNLGLDGEAVPGKPLPWWRRFFSPGGWQRWRLWAVGHREVCLVAVYLPSGPPDRESETVINMVLNTLTLAEQPAVPPRVFAERVLELAREKFPLLECEPADDFRVRIGESSVNLFNFYRSYINDPDRFEEIVLPALTTVVQVQEWGRNQTEPPLEQVRERVLPMLYPESAWRENFPNFVATPWVAGLMVLYVVDESQAYWYIRNDLLQRWEIEPETLHELALGNLDAYFEEHPMEFTLAGEEGGPRLLMPNRADAYNTSRMLSETFHHKLRDLLGSQFAVGVPSRDFFVAVSLDCEQTVEQVRHKVGEDFSHLDHPLSERLLLVSADGVSEYFDE